MAAWADGGSATLGGSSACRLHPQAFPRGMQGESGNVPFGYMGSTPYMPVICLSTNAFSDTMQTMQEREYNIPTLPLPYDLETKAVLLQLNRSNRSLAELKGASKIIPNEGILINTLALQEARESSSIENVITTQDELYQAGVDGNYVFANPATKEVLNYREAMEEGFHRVARQGMLTNNVIKAVQETLEHNKAGFRRDAVLLKNSAGDVVYTPPRDWMDVERLMGNLECFINDDSLADCDPCWISPSFTSAGISPAIKTLTTRACKTSARKRPTMRKRGRRGYCTCSRVSKKRPLRR